MLRYLELLLAFLRGLFGLGPKRVRGPTRKRKARPARASRSKPPVQAKAPEPAPPEAPPPAPKPPAATPSAPREQPAERPAARTRRRTGPDRLATELTEALPLIPHPGGEWDPRERVGVEDGRVAVDLHGLSDEDAVALVEEVLAVLAGGGPDGAVPLRLITGHGRDRPAGYSVIRMALVDALAERDDIRIDQLGRHRRHAESDDRLGHMDLLVA